ncbi:zinc ribbon domain-containing protein [Oceanobacillus sp. J11TS1]|uniref:zinc ribbon domain-containing protein n=1 Tax=Oceanobacillus sp. J11TS1 TaxID=2807191 RepID=UPI001B03D7C0|nr:zinc ribbon domain-containing protein [Oceanobacillus sp. J11TS1]GIO24591.1 hypothetical protein J11TS1_31720 [Oceanobacillus sp. J11TS1]
MICPSCHQETEEGKFCTKCGQPLNQQENTPIEPVEPTSQEQAASTAETANQSQQEEQSESTPYTVSDLGATVKELSGGFGHFALAHLKSPGKARNLTERNWISGAISIVLTALLYSILLYITLNQFSLVSPPFMDSFLVPFLKFLLFFAGSIIVIFGAGRILGSQDNFFDTTAKTGGYLLPYTVFFVVGYLLVAIGLDFMVYVMLLAILAPMLFIPAYVLMDSISREIDKIYALTAVFLIHLILGYYLLLETFMGSIFANVLNNFGFW